MKEGLLIIGTETLVSKRLNGLNPSLQWLAFTPEQKSLFRPFMSVFQTFIPIKFTKMSLKQGGTISSVEQLNINL